MKSRGVANCGFGFDDTYSLVEGERGIAKRECVGRRRATRVNPSAETVDSGDESKRKQQKSSKQRHDARKQQRQRYATFFQRSSPLSTRLSYKKNSKIVDFGKPVERVQLRPKKVPLSICGNGA